MIRVILIALFCCLMTGCSIGITSNLPILNKGESDQLDGIAGYWKLISQTDRDGKKSNDEVFFIDDYSTGSFFAKDYKYKFSWLTKGDLKDKELILRIKKVSNQYAAQVCYLIENNEGGCYYGYGAWEKNGEIFSVMNTSDENLSSSAKDLLGDLYVNSSNKADIKLTDQFVATKGKKQSKRLRTIRSKIILAMMADYLHLKK